MFEQIVIGLIVTVVGGLMLYYLFGIGRDSSDKKKSKKIGILNKGKNNQFINNTFEGFDVGIQDEGENTKASGNSFFGTLNIHPNEINWTKLGVILTVFIGVLSLSWAVYAYYFPKQSPMTNTEVLYENSPLSTDTPDLSDIFKKSNSLSTSLEKQNLIDNYKDSTVNGSGAFTDIGRSGSEGYIVEMTIERNAVGCRFGTSSEKTLLLLNKGDTVNFSGTFTGGGLAFGSSAVNPWYIADCVLR